MYATEAHTIGFTTAPTYEEKVGAAIGLVEQYNITVPVLVDETDVRVWTVYGLRPNNAFLIGTDGIIVAEQNWYDAEVMEQTIVEHLGIIAARPSNIDENSYLEGSTDSPESCLFP